MILSAGRLAVLAAAGCAVVAGCVRGGGSSPVPRPEAYPRIDLYPSFYRAVDLPDGRVIQVNDSAGVDVDAEGWVNISYPKYGVTVNCTLTRVSEATVGDVLSNRDERMALNTGDTYGEVMRLGVSAGIVGHCVCGAGRVAYAGAVYCHGFGVVCVFRCRRHGIGRCQCRFGAAGG